MTRSNMASKGSMVNHQYFQSLATMAAGLKSTSFFVDKTTCELIIVDDSRYSPFLRPRRRFPSHHPFLCTLGELASSPRR